MPRATLSARRGSEATGKQVSRKDAKYAKVANSPLAPLRELF
jgi:hypothetical protein